MTRLIRAGDLIGLPVVAIASGEDVAEIRDVVYDSAQHRLVGFTLNKRGFFAGRMKDVLPAAAVAAIGADAVMVPDDAAISHSDTPESLDHPGEANHVIGTRALSADGTELGEVVGVILETGANPSAVGYEIEVSDGSEKVFVPISAQMALSDDNLMLPDESTEFIRNDLAGFGAAVTSYRASMLSRSEE